MIIEWNIGDHCWYFDNLYKRIGEAIITQYGYNEFYAKDVHTGIGLIFNEHYLPFPSREELCDYYRKIFEPQNVEEEHLKK